MRRLVLAALALTLGAGVAQAGAESREPHPIRKLEVRVRTGDDFGATTDDAVWFSMGPSYEWALETPGKRPFLNGAADRFTLPPQGLMVEDIKWIRVRKSRGDEWLLQGIEVWIDGRPWYRNDELNLWFDERRDEWTAPRLPGQQ